jgi:hypothetical protein
MAVVAFLNGGDLFGINNANQVLASNIGTQGTPLQLANTRLINFTPTAGTIKGVTLCLFWAGQNTGTNITVKLQQNIAGTWTDVVGTTKTATASQITRTSTDLYPAGNTSGQFDYFFEFPTPAVVTNVANTWRIDVTTVGGNPSLMTSDNTNPFFVLVGTVTTTFITNQDQPIITNSQPVTFSSNVRFLSILGTGGTRGVCGFLGSGANGLPSSVKMLICNTSGLTVTLNGLFSKCTFSAESFGTESTPLSNFTVNYDTSTVGTANLTGFTTTRADADGTSAMQKISMYWYGAIPTLNRTYLTANASVGATSIEVEDTTNWVNGDRIDIGGQTTQGIGDTQVYTVSSTSGKTINFTPALQAGGGTRLAGQTGTLSIANPCVVTWGTARGHGLLVGDVVYFRTTGALPTGVTAGQKYYVVSRTFNTFTFSDTLGGTPIATTGTQSGVHTICVAKYAGRVIKMNGYGIFLKTNVTGGVAIRLGAPAVIKTIGTQIQDVSFIYATNGGRDTEFVSAWQNFHEWKQLSFEFLNNFTAGNPQMISVFSSPTIAGTKVSFINARRGSILGSVSYTGGASDTFNFEDNINLKTGFTSGNGYSVGVAGMKIIFTRNHIENSNLQLTLSCAVSSFTDNRFWGCSTTVGYLRFNTVVNSEFTRNIFDNSSNGMSLVSVATGCTGLNNIYSPLIANITDFNFLAGFIGYVEDSPLTSVVVDEGANSIFNCVEGSEMRIANYPPLVNDNRVWQKYGRQQSTGSGLVDTISRIVGSYAFRQEPTSLVNKPIAFPLSVKERVQPTGNIQNKTMTFSVWIAINNSAYSTGTHLMPTLNVKYDNATVITAVSQPIYINTHPTNYWQRLSVVFTPQTTFGQFEWWVTGATSATGSNRYFYIAEREPAYPAGVAVNTLGNDNWASGYPVLPAIYMFPPQSFLLDEQMAGHNIPGSFGKLVKDIEVKADDSTVFNLIQ